MAPIAPGRRGACMMRVELAADVAAGWLKAAQPISLCMITLFIADGLRPVLLRIFIDAKICQHLGIDLVGEADTRVILAQLREAIRLWASLRHAQEKFHGSHLLCCWCCCEHADPVVTPAGKPAKCDAFSWYETVRRGNRGPFRCGVGPAA